jgi:DNA-binding transcriptional LysR family regulator
VDSKNRPLPGEFLRRVKLRQIELLFALQSSATLKQAARLMFLSQPAASKLLKSLQQDLGLQLFARDGRNLKPTPAGRILMRHAAQVMGDLGRASREVDAIRGGAAGQVALGTLVAATHVLVPRAVARWLARAPRRSVSIRDGVHSELLLALFAGELDIVVGRQDQGRRSAELHQRPLYDEPICVVCHPRHPLANRKRIDWPDLKGYEWLLPWQDPIRRRLEDLLARVGGRPAVSVIESASFTTNIMLMSERPLLTVLSRVNARRYQDLGLVRQLSMPAMAGPGPISVYWPRTRELAPAAHELIESLSAVAADLGAGTN